MLPKAENEVIKLKRRACKYALDGGVLYRVGKGGLALRCVNKHEALKILGELHEEICGNHSGGRSLAHRVLSQGYYWPTLKKESEEYVRKCEKCQRHARVSHLPASEVNMITSHWPFSK